VDKSASSLVAPAEFGLDPGEPRTVTRVLLCLIEIAPNLDDVFLDALAQAPNFHGVFGENRVIDYEIADVGLDDCGAGVDISVIKVPRSLGGGQETKSPGETAVSPGLSS
jgi:hypothetical protein